MLNVLAESPNDPSVLNFLVNGNVAQIPTLKTGLTIFKQLNSIVQSKMDDINEQYEALSSEVIDTEFKHLLQNVKQFSKEDSSQYGSSCGLMALKVIEFFSKYIDRAHLTDFEALKGLETLKTSNVEALATFDKGAGTLLGEIKKDLRKGEHKLYYCILDNALFKDVGGWQHPHYQGHPFVIEKTKADQFRIYQSYDSQYSLKSHLASELAEYPEALRSYGEFYPFMKGLQQLELATQWDASVNDVYKRCFGVDHKTFVGEKLKSDFFSMRFKSLVVHEDEVKAEQDAPIVEKGPTILDQINDLRRNFAPYEKNIKVGAAIGSSVTALALGSIFVVTQTLSKVGII